VGIGDAVRLRIIGLCEERKISINKLCSISGVTQSTINNIVSGRNRSTTIVTIKKLCDGLGISITICALLSAKRLQGTRNRSEVVSAEWLAAVNLFSRLCAHICTIVQHALHESFQNRFQFFLRRQSCRTLDIVQDGIGQELCLQASLSVQLIDGFHLPWVGYTEADREFSGVFFSVHDSRPSVPPDRAVDSLSRLQRCPQ